MRVEMSGDDGDVDDQSDGDECDQGDRRPDNEAMAARERVADEKEGDAPKVMPRPADRRALSAGRRTVSMARSRCRSS